MLPATGTPPHLTRLAATFVALPIYEFLAVPPDRQRPEMFPSATPCARPSGPEQTGTPTQFSNLWNLARPNTRYRFTLRWCGFSTRGVEVLLSINTSWSPPSASDVLHVNSAVSAPTIHPCSPSCVSCVNALTAGGIPTAAFPPPPPLLLPTDVTHLAVRTRTMGPGEIWRDQSEAEKDREERGEMGGVMSIQTCPSWHLSLHNPNKVHNRSVFHTTIRQGARRGAKPKCC